MLFVCIAIYSCLQKFVKIVKNKKKQKKKKKCKKTMKYQQQQKISLSSATAILVHASREQAFIILAPLNPTFI